MFGVLYGFSVLNWSVCVCVCVMLGHCVAIVEWFLQISRMGFSVPNSHNSSSKSKIYGDNWTVHSVFMRFSIATWIVYYILAGIVWTDSCKISAHVHWFAPDRYIYFTYYISKITRKCLRKYHMCMWCLIKRIAHNSIMVCQQYSLLFSFENSRWSDTCEANLYICPEMKQFLFVQSAQMKEIYLTG